MSARGGGRRTADSPELRRLRARIDALDRKLVALLNERAALTSAIGGEKARLGRAVRDAAREREVLLRVSMANGGPTPQAELLAIYRRVIAAARSLETRERERLRRDEPEPPGDAEPPVA